jgi:Ca-activated chloride channel family protein
MTPARKTTGILIMAAAVAAAASLLTMAQHSTRAASARNGDIEVRARLQSSHVLLGLNEAHMAITVKAPDGDGNAARPPLNLSVVIDRSGSMSGEKIEHAKLAARQLVSRLRESDRVAVIAYGSDVDIVFSSRTATSQAKSEAIAAIDRIYDDGGTNLSGGLMAGRDEVMPHRSGEVVSRVVLISDGMANEGISDRSELAQLAGATAERGVSITTIGVGLDFDESTMTALAVSGAGNYYFVESSDALAKIFDDELDKIGETVATEVKVALEPASGVEILEAYGYDITREGNHAIINVADLHAGETRKVVLRLRVNATKPGAIDLADVTVGYRNVSDGEHNRVDVHARAETTRDQQVVLANADKDALVHIERAKNAAAINRATALYERGDMAAAQAVLGARKQEAAELAEKTEFKALEQEADEATDWAEGNMQAAPSSAGAGGSRAKKANRKGAYDMMY